MGLRHPFQWPFYLQTLVAMALGVGAGVAFGAKAGSLAIVGTWIIQVIKAFATPLLFFAILDSILEADFKAKGFVRLFAVCTVNGLCAIGVALFLLNTFHPGHYFSVAAVSPHHKPPKATWAQSLSSQIPESVLSPFVNNSIPAVIVLALLFGFALRALQKEFDSPKNDRLAESIKLLFQLHLKVIGWTVKLAPVAVFTGVAKAVGQHGFSVLPGLGAYLAVCLVGMGLQVTLVYQSWILGVARLSLARFWREAKEPAIYSFGVNSSLATLPLTLKALERLKVSPGSARLAACVGTNLNNDGILLYEVAAALFLAQAHGVMPGLWGQVALAAVCVMATLGVAGVPEAGFIALALVLSTAGLPAESLPLLLAVDWILARTRSVVNVTSDMTVALALDAIEKRGLAPDRVGPLSAS